MLVDDGNLKVALKNLQTSMFISDTHHPQLLTPDFYFSDEQFQREVNTLFLPGWHCVAAMADFPNDGDVRTLDLFGHPVLLWRMNGEVRAFLNVCSHRYCTITDQEQCNMSKLKCQYHGWEYDEEGTTRKIPDAPSFRPLEKDALGLRQLKIQRCGTLLFVSVAEEPEPLEQQLGPGHEMGERIFSEDWEPMLCLRHESACNWKVVLENYLEGYHIDCVHPTTFKKFHNPDNCAHELGDLWTLFSDSSMDNDRITQGVMRASGATSPGAVYQHLHCYPSQTMGQMAAYSFMQNIRPLTPSSPGLAVVGSRVFPLPGWFQFPLRQ